MDDLDDLGAPPWLRNPPHGHILGQGALPSRRRARRAQRHGRLLRLPRGPPAPSGDLDGPKTRSKYVGLFKGS